MSKSHTYIKYDNRLKFYGGAYAWRYRLFNFLEGYIAFDFKCKLEMFIKTYKYSEKYPTRGFAFSIGFLGFGIRKYNK